ncbi:unnamed protein product [Prunus armeniaca]
MRREGAVHDCPAKTVELGRSCRLCLELHSHYLFEALTHVVWVLHGLGRQDFIPSHDRLWLGSMEDEESEVNENANGGSGDEEGGVRVDGGSGEGYKDADEVVTFKFFHGELFGMTKDLGYDNGYDVSFYGEEFGTGRLIQIILDSTLLACMSTVPKSNSRVIVLYLKVVSLTLSQVGNDSSDLEFEDSDYAQSDEEIDLLKKDVSGLRQWRRVTYTYLPNSSSSEDEAVGELRRKKNRMPKEQVHQDYGYRPSKATVYRERAMTVDIVEGSYSDRPQFQSIYICLTARKKGFLDGCRPVVCLDECHVKGPHPGQVLSAMGVDANNGMFPLAYAYVEIESNSTWLYVVDALFPHAEYRHCLKHLYGNFYLEQRGLALKHQMQAIARAITIPLFHAEMRKMLELSKPAHDSLAKKDPRH